MYAKYRSEPDVARDLELRSQLQQLLALAVLPSPTPKMMTFVYWP